MRLRSILKNRPKSMALVNGRPFLDTLLDYLLSYGVGRIILAVGYRKDIIKEYYRKKKKGAGLIFAEEVKPLGTGGALKNALRFAKSRHILVLNGDSFCNTDLVKFLNFHKQKKAILSLVLAKKEGASEYGVVKIDKASRVTSFCEKGKIHSGFVNAGIYLFSRGALRYLPRGKNFSLEYDLFPSLTKTKCCGYLTSARLIDIGTPQKIKEAEKFFQYAK